MIPEKKKTAEELNALRGELGIPAPAAGETKDPPPETERPPGEPVIHLDIPATPVPKWTPDSHRLRKRERPLAPAPDVTHKTALPSRRHDPSDIARIRKREALANLDNKVKDPAARLRAQTASPFLYAPGYLLGIAAAAVAYQRVHHITPIVLLTLSLLVALYIAIRKPRSRHHAALIFILVFLTAAFGGLHYAPLFQHGP